MPDPYDRHGRSRDPDWGSNPPRSQQRAAAAEDDKGKRPPGKKDPDLCKAEHWKAPHQLVLRIRELGWRREMKCGWGTSYFYRGDARWHCAHEEACSGCGKIMFPSIPKERCPEYHEITSEELAAVQADYARREAAISRARRRPVIDGPQGYRKQKGKDV